MIHLFDAAAARPALQWSWVTLSGRDARDFLHRLTTINVNALGVGQGSAGCFLNAQGKIRAFFTLWHFALDHYAFEFDAGASGHWKPELLAAIEQYTFAEKFEISDLTSLASRWILLDPEEEAQGLATLGAGALKAGETLAVDEEIRICHHGSLDFGRALVTAWGRPARLAQWIERLWPQGAAGAASSRQLEQWRVQALRPRVDAEITTSTIPLEAGLKDALAQAKGCYPGQEVIERIVSLGAPARRLVRMDGEGAAPSAGDTIYNLAEPPVELGQITSVAVRVEQSGFQALGYIRKIHAKEGLEVRLGAAGSRGVIARVADYV